MPLALSGGTGYDWSVRKIGVVGPGIVGMPMAALLARASACGAISTRPEVVVVQRPSVTSGWKVNAINAGRSPIGGVEPELDAIVRATVGAGTLRATHSAGELADADVVLVCTQTDRDGLKPDYGPLLQAANEVANALRARPRGHLPLVVFESTLAPSSMQTVVRSHFAGFDLTEGRDILLGNSPNRVMPGRLVERVTTASKLVAGLHPVTPRLIAQLYESIVTTGTLHETNSLTAEVVKTLENAYRDIRIAFAAEVVRFCDSRDIDFHDVRRRVNERLGQTDSASSDPSAVPTGGLLIPTIGVGGHCLPKDGILLCWRRLQRVRDTAASLFLESRRINDESPGAAIRLAERAFGSLAGRRIALLGTAYRPDSEDTRNSPTLVLASEMQGRGMDVTLHDPHVRRGDQNLLRTGLDSHFTRDIGEALSAADIVMLCVAHRAYTEDWGNIRRVARAATAVFDGCNLFPRESARGVGLDTFYPGIGRGRRPADRDLVHAVVADFHTVERGVANELAELIDLFNADYVRDDFNRVNYADVQRLAATCSTGCEIVRPGFIDAALGRPFSSRLATCARRAAVTRSFVAGVPS